MENNRILFDDTVSVECILPNSVLQLLETSQPSKPSQASAVLSNTKSPKETAEETNETNPVCDRCPILTKRGYHCSPSIDTLQKYTEEELKKVDHFSIWVDQIGMIEWEEPVDLCGLDLDKLIIIEKENGSSVIEVSFILFPLLYRF